MKKGNIIAFERPKAVSGGWSAFVAITSGLSITLFLVIFLNGSPTATKAAMRSDLHQADFGNCFGPIRTTCIVDGDTFWFKGRKIRVADINTPEISNPGCAYEEQLGHRAKVRLTTLLNAGAFSLDRIARDQDKYGRDLRLVTREDESLGDILVAEGLAEEWQGYRRNWCL